MSEEPSPDPPPHRLDYAEPRADPSQRWSLLRGIVIGVICGVVGVPGFAMLCSWIDARINPGELAGLGGLFVGAMLAAVMVVVVSIIFLVVAHRTGRAAFRGVAVGLLGSMLTVLLAVGICAVGL